MIKDLVVNGCSYMNHYACGHGHMDLARDLNLESATDLSLPGSCNDRIIRTTLRHSYQTQRPTFYLIGATFLNRTELPVLQHATYDGRWISLQQNPSSTNLAWPWTDRDTIKFIDLWLRAQVAGSLRDSIEKLMYQLLSMIGDLKHRGHRVLVFQQAAQYSATVLDDLTLFNQPEFVQGFRWRAIPWQLEQGALPITKDVARGLPPDIMHVAPGQHRKLNEFLLEYISNNGILDRA